MGNFPAAHQVWISLPSSRKGDSIADIAWKTSDGKRILNGKKLSLMSPFTDRQEQDLHALIDGGRRLWQK